MTVAPPPNGSVCVPFPSVAEAVFSAISRDALSSREPCYCCKKSRLDCWLDPCAGLLAITRDIRDPRSYERLLRWCAEGGFELHRTGNLDWPIARPWFYVGDGANYSFNGDAYPVTVIEVSPNGTRITVRRDRATKKDAIFAIDAKGKTMTFTRRKDGSYRSSKCGTWVLGLGRTSERNREL